MIEPGRWLMDNGHTARIDRRLDIPFKDVRTGEPRTYSVWCGECEECRAPMTWNINGKYAAAGSHRNDIVKRAT